MCYLHQVKCKLYEKKLIHFGRYKLEVAGSISCDACARFRVMTSPYGVARLHSLDAPRSVGLLWTSDQSKVETSA